MNNNTRHLFMQPWWLDAVCSENKNWHLIDNYPLLINRKIGFRYSLQPQLTQYFKIDDVEKFIDIIDKLHLDYIYQQILCDSFAVDKLKSNKFDVQKRVSYQITDLSDIENIKRSFSENKRRQIKHAERENLSLDYDLSASEFYQFHHICLQKRGLKINYSQRLFEALHEATFTRKQGQIIAVRNLQNVVTAAVFLAWDSEVCYYLIPTYDIDYTKTGSMAWLTFEAIRFAKSKSKIFDFEGSMVSSIANSYRQFGSTEFTYYSIEKRNNKFFSFLFDFYKKIRR